MALCGLIGSASAVQAQGRPVWVQSSGEEVAGKKTRVVARLSSQNAEPVGLLGGPVRTTLVAYKMGPKSEGKAQGHIEFSANVLVNSYSRKVCHTTSCVMEARFDNLPAERFRLFEAGPDVYLKRVMVLDDSFFKKAFKSRSISIKLKFADAVEGVFNFRNSSDFEWKEAP